MKFSKGTSVYQHLMDIKKQRGAGFLVLLDPDRSSQEALIGQAMSCRDAGVDALLVGTSLMMSNGFEDSIKKLGKAVDIPVIVFPGGISHVTGEADAILFLSLISGRNPEYIIGEQVRSAPIIRNMGLEAIATAYMLIESGRVTSVEFMSNTKPIPSNKPDIAAAHAIAAEIMGMKLVYLEAGSGANQPVPDEMIREVVSEVSIPVIVGGGIRDAETVAAKAAAGASFIVVGNHLENCNDNTDLKTFVDAAHYL